MGEPRRVEVQSAVRALEKRVAVTRCLPQVNKRVIDTTGKTANWSTVRARGQRGDTETRTRNSARQILCRLSQEMMSRRSNERDAATRVGRVTVRSGPYHRTGARGVARDSPYCANECQLSVYHSRLVTTIRARPSGRRPVKAAHGPSTTHGPTQQTGGIESSATTSSHTRHAHTRSLLRVVDERSGSGRDDDVVESSSAANREMRKTRSAENFLHDRHEFFVVANITTRKFG